VLCLFEQQLNSTTVCEFGEGVFPGQENQLKKSLQTRTDLFVTKKSVYLDALFTSAKVFSPAALTGMASAQSPRLHFLLW